MPGKYLSPQSPGEDALIKDYLQVMIVTAKYREHVERDL
jgi:hypothetical protein